MWEFNQVVGVDLVKRFKLNGAGEHFGVCVRFAGLSPLIYDLTMDGLRRVRYGDFAEGRSVTIVHQLTDCRRVAAALERLRKAAGDQPGYDLLQRNCEHWAREIVFGTSSSSQVSKLIVAAGMLAIAFIAMFSK